MPWYHASASDLPEGTRLVPGPGFASVFMSKDLDTAHDWAHLLGNDHVYEVTPSSTPVKRYEKDALGDYEWLAESATITRKIGIVRDASEYCDGCLAIPPRRISANVRTTGTRAGAQQTRD